MVFALIATAVSPKWQHIKNPAISCKGIPEKNETKAERKKKREHSNKMLSVGASWRCRAMMLAQLKRVISSNCYKALLIGCLIKLGQKQSSTRVGVKVGICRRFTLMGKGLLAVKWRKSYLPVHSPSLSFSLSPGLGLTCFFPTFTFTAILVPQTFPQSIFHTLPTLRMRNAHFSAEGSQAWGQGGSPLLLFFVWKLFVLSILLTRFQPAV